MEIKIIEDNFDQEKYNEVATHPLQSWEWGQARKIMGIEVIRIGEFNENRLENVYQLTLHKIPHTPYNIAYLPKSSFPSNEVIELLSDLAKKYNMIFIKIEPHEYQSPQLESHIKKLSSTIRKSPHSLFSDWTIVLDLNKSEEELLENMKPKTRYNIKLAQKKGVVVKEESNERGFNIFSRLYFETCKRQKYYGHTQEYHQIVWNNLQNNIAHILIAYYENEPLAAFELFFFKKFLYYPYGGTSLLNRNVMAANLLMWEAIKFGKQLGADKFDMWNSLSPNYEGNLSWSGFTRFKEGYGGEFIHMAGSFDLVINNNLYQIYNILHKARTFYLKVKST